MLYGHKHDRMLLRFIISALLLTAAIPALASPVITASTAGNQGFDVYADGVLVAPVRLAANGAIVADQVETNASGVRLSGLHAIDTSAVTFAADDFVSVTLPSINSTNTPLLWEPTV